MSFPASASLVQAHQTQAPQFCVVFIVVESPLYGPNMIFLADMC